MAEDLVRILEELKAKREALDEAIESISRYLGVEGVATSGNGRAVAGAFTGMTVLEAAKKYLASVKRSAPTKEIVAALERGGLQHNAKDFYASVYAILRQQAQKGPKGGIRRSALDWELVEESS
jgi:hypothetical protein